MAAGCVPVTKGENVDDATGAGPIAADTPVPLGPSTAPHPPALHPDWDSWLITEPGMALADA